MTGESVSSTDFDTTSDPNFVAYYESESDSPAAWERFTRLRDTALMLLESVGRKAGPLDVIDIGCGAGTQAILWSQLGHRVSAIDLNSELVEIGKRRAADRGLQIRFDVGSATSLPYADSAADAVFLPELLEHVSQWEACLSEAVRVSRPGALLYLSTTNRLCPVQQEFSLPGYSWYPGVLKRWCEKKSVTSHPQWVNFARYPAVNWFSFYDLARWLRRHGFEPIDRFDVLARRQLAGAPQMAIRAVRAFAPLRLMAHMATPGTVVWAFRQGV